MHAGIKIHYTLYGTLFSLMNLTHGWMEHSVKLFKDLDYGYGFIKVVPPPQQ